MRPSIKQVTASASLVLAGWLLAGCATAPAEPGAWVSPTTGTVTTYQRQSSGSFGTAQTQVVWTVEAGRVWEGRRVVPGVSPQAGTSLYDAQTHGYRRPARSRRQTRRVLRSADRDAIAVWW